jgi:type I restriction enzyme S subunit
LRQEELYRLQTGGAQPHVHPKDFYTIRIGLPETLEEQIEIGKVIRDSDELVELVKSRRDAAVSLKLGVLQEVFNYDSGDEGRNQD